MQIELVGCTCAGKTTLARRLVELGLEQGIDAQRSDDFMLSCLHLNGIKNEFVRRRLIEFWAFWACLRYFSKYREFYGFVIRTCISVPGSVAYRLKLIRVVLKKVGIYEIISRRSAGDQLILLDNEGILQASHTLFVHANGDTHDYKNQLTDFLNRVPLPDAIVYLRQPESVLIERTLKRGHNRIHSDAGDREVAAFIGQAVLIFEAIKHTPRFSDRLLVINGEQSKLQGIGDIQSVKLARVAGLISAVLAWRPRHHGLDKGGAGDCSSITGFSSTQS